MPRSKSRPTKRLQLWSEEPKNDPDREMPYDVRYTQNYPNNVDAMTKPHHSLNSLFPAAKRPTLTREVKRLEDHMLPGKNWGSGRKLYKKTRSRSRRARKSRKHRV